MKVAVVGSRQFQNYDFMRKVLSQHNITAIVSGGAGGADALAEKYATENGIPIIRHHADWSNNRFAGTERNTNLIDACDIVIAFVSMPTIYLPNGRCFISIYDKMSRDERNAIYGANENDAITKAYRANKTIYVYQVE